MRKKPKGPTDEGSARCYIYDPGDQVIPAAEWFAACGYIGVYCVDFEFQVVEGNHPVVHCMCYREVISGAEVKLHGDDLRNLKRSPIPTGPEHLFVPYYGSAELGCYLALGWEFPEAIFDVYVAFVMAMYGRLSREQMRQKGWRSLVGAVAFVTGEQNAFPEKKVMRELAIRGAPFTDDEMSQLLEYCLDDARANERVLSWAVERTCELPAGPVKAWAQALFRGKFMGAAAIAERNGVSIDVEKLGLIRKHRALIRRRLVKAVDVDFGVCAEDGISPLKLRDYVEEHGLAWPRTPKTGWPVIEREIFEKVVEAYPFLGPLFDLNKLVKDLKTEHLTVGSDGRNRTLLSCFGTLTGRNAPSGSRSIFGLGSWMRGLIKPPPGRAIIDCDFSSQEVCVAACLSGDDRMIADCETGDPHMDFAIRAGLAPPGATKATHPKVRDKCKVMALGLLYGMGTQSLASKVGCTIDEARDLRRAHQRAYPQFWRWATNSVALARFSGELHTPMGWSLRVTPHVRVRTLLNFPVQATAADMLRLAMCQAVEAGLMVCAPLHDSLMIECAIEDVDASVAQLQAIMREASLLVLGGKLAIRTDAEIVRYPDRYMDPRGAKRWAEVMQLIDEAEADALRAAA